MVCELHRHVKDFTEAGDCLSRRMFKGEVGMLSRPGASRFFKDLIRVKAWVGVNKMAVSEEK